MPHIIVSVGVMAKETIRFFVMGHSFSAWLKHENTVRLVVKSCFFQGVWFRATIVSQVKGLCRVIKT